MVSRNSYIGCMDYLVHANAVRRAGYTYARQLLRAVYRPASAAKAKAA